MPFVWFIGLAVDIGTIVAQNQLSSQRGHDLPASREVDLLEMSRSLVPVKPHRSRPGSSAVLRRPWFPVCVSRPFSLLTSCESANDRFIITAIAVL